jgi:hypothetical protein
MVMGMGVTMLAVIVVVVKKVAVAMTDRGERRDRPLTMWPDVQPAPFWTRLLALLHGSDAGIKPTCLCAPSSEESSCYCR